MADEPLFYTPIEKCECGERHDRVPVMGQSETNYLLTPECGHIVLIPRIQALVDFAGEALADFRAGKTEVLDEAAFDKHDGEVDEESEDAG